MTDFQRKIALFGVCILAMLVVRVAVLSVTRVTYWSSSNGGGVQVAAHMPTALTDKPQAHTLTAHMPTAHPGLPITQISAADPGCIVDTGMGEWHDREAAADGAACDPWFAYAPAKNTLIVTPKLAPTSPQSNTRTKK